LSAVSPSGPPPTSLIRIPIHFEAFRNEILGDLGASLIKPLAAEYLLVRMHGAPKLAPLPTPRFVRWMIPMDHLWPCQPRKMADFTEKAARTLATKFSGRDLQGVFIGLLDPSAKDAFYKTMATSLRGRTLQLFGDEAKGFRKVEEQDPMKPSLFCLIGDEGLYGGVSSPGEANGFYPGGTKFISQKAPHMISRAGAKIAEALHYLRLHLKAPAAGSHWLELGACPGGMTSELLERGYKVTAVDRAPLDPRLKGREHLHFVKADSADFVPDPGIRFDALLCDMNGETDFALGQVVRHAKALKPDGLVVFTLKTAGVTDYQDILRHYRAAMAQAVAGGLRLVTSTHLTYNRHEFTLFFEKR
jgi:hypothetical protein